MKHFNIYNLLFIFLLAFLLQSCSVYRPTTVQSKGIYFEGKVNLGNFKQAVVVRGNNKKNPVLLHLHGGPGYPLFPYISNFYELEKHFTVVYWEQRGTAKSLNRKLNKNSMTTNTLLNDLTQLVNWIQTNIDTSKIYLWGHSWGTNLGMMYAHKHPEKLKAYIGTGQSVNLKDNERYCYKFVKQNAETYKHKKALKCIKNTDTTNYTLKNALKIRKWIYRFGGIEHTNYKQKSYRNFDIVKKIFETPEYSCSDKWRLIFRSTYSGKTLWNDMMRINLFNQVKEVNCPIYFFEGKYDALVSCTLAKQYFNFIKANKGKYLIWFDKSAHRPQTEEPKKFIHEMRKIKNIYN